MNEDVQERYCVALLNDLPAVGLPKSGAVVPVNNGSEAVETEFPTGARKSIVFPADLP